MLSERLLDFLEDWCGLDTDAEDAAEMLRGPGGAYYLPWLPGELAQAIRERAITPELMSSMLTLHVMVAVEPDTFELSVLSVPST